MGNPKIAQNRYLARMTTRDTPHIYVRVRWGGGQWVVLLGHMWPKVGSESFAALAGGAWTVN